MKLYRICRREITLSEIEAEETKRMYVFMRSEQSGWLEQIRKAEVDNQYGQLFTSKQNAIDAMRKIQERDIVQAMIDVERSKKILEQLSALESAE